MEQPGILVVGGGPVGVRAANEIARRGQAVTLLTAEPFQPYNRVRLTPLLAGDVQFGEIEVPQVGGASGVTCVTGLPVTHIDREARQVRTADGGVWPYSKLLLATGSRAFVPSIPGADLAGVFTFRTAADASALLARSFSARRVVVIGGGLLGLEAARGMRQRQSEVVVVEHEGRVMPRQLDAEAGALLAERIEALGVRVFTGVAVRQIAGENGKVTGILLANGTTIVADTVIICTGVRANTDLARDAGLPVGRGIIVNDTLQSADPDIFAVGECAEHGGRVYGLVGPGYAQADVAAAVLSDQPAQYRGTVSATKLKVIGAEVFSAGEVEVLDARPDSRSHVWRSHGQYRRIFLDRGKLAGAIAVGGWDQASRAQNAVQAGMQVHPWQVWRFLRTGLLWPTEDLEVADLPEEATVCNCTGVTAGRLRACRAVGAGDAPALSLATGAGTVCGSCVPQLEELADAGGPPKPVRLYKALIALSALAGLLALALAVLPRIPYPTSFDADSIRDWLWRDPIIKQWTGWGLLAIAALAMTIGLRKRLRITDRLGAYDGWRLVHLGIGLLAAIGLVVHTGLRPGANLNLALFASFTATLVMGAVAGLATGGDHALRARRIGTSRKPARSLPVWIHILAVWPLPVLILVHVVIVYAY